MTDRRSRYPGTTPGSTGIDEPTRRPDGGGDAGTSRRRFLQATSVTLATLGLAGCSGITNQEFTAQPVTIPESARSELGYAEQRSEEKTVTKSTEVAGVEVSATIQSYYATYAPEGLAQQIESAATSSETSGSGLQARKEVLFAGLRSLGSKDLLTLPSMAAISTPKGEVAGQQLNPLANKDLGTLIQSDQASGLLAQGGGSSSTSMPNSINWRRDPQEVNTSDVSLVDTATTLRAMGGVIEGSNTPLFLLGTLARAVNESVIITAGTMALPIQNPERVLVGADGFLTNSELGTVLEGAVAANEAVQLQ